MRKFKIICSAIMLLSLLVAPAAMAAAPTQGDVGVLNLQISAMGDKAKANKKEIDEVRKLIAACHGDNACKKPAVRNSTRGRVRYVVKKWNLNREDMNLLLGAIDALWARIETRFDRVDKAHKSIMDVAVRIEAAIRRVEGQFQQCGCKCIPRSNGKMHVKIQMAVGEAIEKLCPDTTKLMIEAMDEGCDLIVNPDGTTILECKDGRSSGRAGTAVAKILGFGLGGAAIGCGVAAWAWPTTADGPSGTFRANSCWKGGAIGLGTGILTGFIWSLVSGDL